VEMPAYNIRIQVSLSSSFYSSSSSSSSSPFIWFDLFSINQHQHLSSPLKAFSSSFAQTKRIVLVLSWLRPLPLARSWCLFELLLAARGGRKLEIAMSKGEEETLWEQLPLEFYMEMIREIDVEASESSDDEDKRRILALVKDEAQGIAGVNRLVQESLRSWLVQSAEERILRAEVGDDVERKMKLADIYRVQGKLEAAEELYREMHSRSKEQGVEDDVTKEIVRKLAIVQVALAKYEEAEPLLQTFRNRLGDGWGDEELSLESMNGLADYYFSQGRLEEAEPVLKKCIARGEGEEEDRVLALSHKLNLASLHVIQGREEEAETVYQDCVDSSRKALGEQHGITRRGVNALAALYEKQGKFKVAELLVQDSMNKLQAAGGNDHPDMVRGLRCLASLYQSQERYEEAEPLLLESLRRVRAAEGEEHPHTVEDLIGLAKLYVRQRRMEEAEPLLLESMRMLREAAGGGGGPLLLVCMDSLAGVYVEQEKLEEAEPLLLESIAKCREQLGEHHPNTLSRMTQLAVLYYKKGKRGEDEAGKPRMWIR